MLAVYWDRLATFEQPFASILVQSIQQPIPTSPRDIVTWDDQGLVDEVKQEPHHLISADAVTRANHFRGLQVPVHGKHREPGE
ncbi:MAG TPA: hypothetical protein VGJ60_25160, partial [Chloroflexota bacterium]